MGNKSAIHVNDINSSSSSVGSPFWSVGTNNKFNFRKYLKQFLKWSKLLFFLFMMLMGLWGCFQSMFDKTIYQISDLGSGLEFGFPFGTTGDFRFDLQMGPDASQYNVFTNWTCALGDSGYGPFYGLFVWPAACVITNAVYFFRNWWGGMHVLLMIFLLLLFIRLLTLLLTFKSTFQNERMAEVQGKIAEINAKYKDLKDMKSKQMKQQEIMALYKKNDIKPFAAFEQMFLTLPIFLIIYRIVTIVRPIKVTILFNIWNFALSPLTQVFNNFINGGWVYIFFLILVIASQILSIFVPQYFAKKRSSHTNTSKNNKNNKTQYIFVVVMCILVVFSAVGVGVYWFLNSLFSILQSWLVHTILVNRKKKKINSATFTKFEL